MRYRRAETGYRARWMLAICVVLFGSCVLHGCASSAPEVVVYASVDQVYAEPILEAYERETGVRVRAIYDTEASKTTGLAQRLLAEVDRPRADVFWSGEPVQTIRLAEEGVFAPYVPEAASGLPAGFGDPDGLWTAFGGRARILLVRVDMGDAVPTHVAELADARWPAERCGIALPIFGTSSTHAAALYALDGPEEARAFYESLPARGVKVYDGNGAVRDAVVSGEIDWGLTDTDDALSAISRGDGVRIVVPDQGEGERGALVIPNTVALVAGGPDAGQGKRLIDYLLSAQTERELVEAGWIQFPTRVAAPAEVAPGDLRAMEIDLREAYGMLETSQRELREVFVR
ncbi:MAG: extracellular solute-binding protein [Coriobacteriia bacterium]